MFAGIRAAIFDFDGTLVDSEPLHAEAWRAVARERGFPEAAPYLAAVGVADETIAQWVVRDFRPGPGDRELFLEKCRAFDRIRHRLVAVPGALELLRRLKASGVRLAIASNGQREYVTAISASCGLAPLIEAYACGDEVALRKPHPELYLKSAGLLKTDPAHCLAVEDSVDGVASAKAAGLKCIALSGAYAPHELARADLVLPALSEIAARLPG